MKIKYSVGIYSRVSREDRDKVESDSIANQKKMCMDYLKSHSDMRLYDIYEDDGYTGVNFERPNFLRLMEDVKKKKVNCIIVKDLSRFARNWTECGRYIQHVFPCLNIRFIAINDNYDSFNTDPETTHFILPVRNLINENYPGDISVKTRSTFETKRKNGEYVGAFVPYGYMRDAGDKHKLVVDETAAQNVRDIFKMFMEGISPYRIAAILNERSIPTPMEYKIADGSKFKTGFRKNLKTQWTSVAIKRILTNEVYIGNLVQGKKGTVNYKDKNVKLRSEDEWIRVENTHVPIISQSNFELVQKFLRFDTRISPKKDSLYLFSGILFCGDCKQNMVRRTVERNGKKYFYYRCSTHKREKIKCTQHNISETKLTDAVIRVLNSHIEQIIEMKEIISFINTLPAETQKYKKINDEIERLLQEIHSEEAKKDGLYDDLYDGLIKDDDFRRLYDSYSNRIQNCELAIEKCKNEITMLSDNSRFDWMEEFKNHRNITKLDREIVITLIDKIFVYEDGRIEIKYNYGDEYAAMLDYISAYNLEKTKAVI